MIRAHPREFFRSLLAYWSGQFYPLSSKRGASMKVDIALGHVLLVSRSYSPGWQSPGGGVKQAEGIPLPSRR
jgi:8-oxo-dGTP pyrophosphatase MutT (NUDIX family)